jgi:hypothetical protein
MELLSEIIRNEIIDKMDTTATVSEVVDVQLVDGVYVSKVRFCDEKWLSITNKPVFEDVYEFEGAEPLNVRDKVPLIIPKFFWGTPLNTAEEWTNFATREENKLPFIWLVQPSKLKHNDYKQTVRVVADVNLFFVHHSNWKQTNEFRENESIKPLQSVVDEFMSVIDSNRKWFNTPRLNTRTEHPRFGKESTKGVEETVFRSTLAAVKLVMSLDIKENCKC